MYKIKRDDLVELQKGRDRGKRGTVREVLPREGKAIVADVNVMKKHVKPGQATRGGQQARQAGIIDIECDFDAATVGLKVSDHGIGVRPEHVERAFERFWQADTGDHRRFGGVGLGLYLVRRIVERQNGWVSLQPRQSGGTVAEVRLPRADLEDDVKPGRPTAATAGLR